MQYENGADEATNAQCGTMTALYLSTIVWSGPLLLLQIVGEERQRKPKTEGRRTIAYIKSFPQVLMSCFKCSDSKTWGTVSVEPLEESVHPYIPPNTIIKILNGREVWTILNAWGKRTNALTDFSKLLGSSKQLNYFLYE